MVVKSKEIVIHVSAPSAPPSPAKQKIKVTYVDISADRTTINKGESVNISSFVFTDNTIPSGYEGYVNLTLKAINPDGLEVTLLSKLARIPSLSNMSDTVKFTVTLNKEGDWTFWVESEDYVHLKPTSSI